MPDKPNNQDATNVTGPAGGAQRPSEGTESQAGNATDQRSKYGYERMQQLTIYISETDHYAGKPLFLSILELAKQHDAAGATVLKGLAGYSASSHRIQTVGFADLQQKLPLVILIVDGAWRVETMLPLLEAMVSVNGGLITVQDLEAHRYMHPSLPGRSRR